MFLFGHSLLNGGVHNNLLAETDHVISPQMPLENALKSKFHWKHITGTISLGPEA